MNLQISMHSIPHLCKGYTSIFLGKKIARKNIYPWVDIFHFLSHTLPKCLTLVRALFPNQKKYMELICMLILFLYLPDVAATE